jgi:RNA polymerase sigma factor (sigma-70 family)
MNLEAFNMIRYTDDQLINGILQSNPAVIRFVYREYSGMIERMVINKGGDVERAKDIFQEALMVIYLRLKRGELKLSCAFSTYLYAVCKNLWFHAIRKEKEFLVEDFPESAGISEAEPEEYHSEQLTVLFRHHFNNLSDDCRKLLELHFMKTPLHDIMRIMGYNSEHYTADRKYKCKQSLINRIRTDPAFKRTKNGI